ncbi:flagellar hook-associated protein 3 [Rhodoferax koreense]|uniref:Flagellar hook-associated protein 3 n=1 Tax=Rhodoferax koreensis TaxID=1842727 RepID=A0A1P8JSA0_9BURK|nr:flagellar hook-associated protein FlgL [Rhodoferax koreense]APW36611.1 flagellar hook-associated protein 3 [Rhodoferax koreense]
MATTFARLGSYNAFDTATRNLTTRQNTLSSLQEHITAGKRVLRPSDDPTAAAQAERAQTRIARVDTDQRALAMQKNSITEAESTLGEANDAMQAFREKLVAAGNGAYNATDRNSIVQELTSLREQIFTYSNRTDSNGIPLFSGLGSAAPPFVDATTGVQYAAIPGQRPNGEVSVTPTLDGEAAWMSVPTGNGVFAVDFGAANTGTAWSDLGQVTNPSAVTGNNYSIQFSVNAAGVTTYDVTNTTTGTAVATGQPYTSGQAIAFDGMSMVIKGAPKTGDSFAVTPSVKTDVFAVLDKAIAGLKNAGPNVGTLTHGITQALTQIDAGMTRLQASRGLAGDLLNRVDRVDASQQTRAVQLEGDRSRAEDLDMIKALSDQANQQTGYQAALQSYAQIQKLSLFNYLS